MWALNVFFFVVIFAAIRTGDLLSILPISVIYIILLNWLTESEDNNGTCTNTERPSSRDYYHVHWVLDNSNDHLDNTKT